MCRVWQRYREKIPNRVQVENDLRNHRRYTEEEEELIDWNLKNVRYFRKSAGNKNWGYNPNIGCGELCVGGKPPVALPILNHRAFDVRKSEIPLIADVPGWTRVSKSPNGGKSEKSHATLRGNDSPPRQSGGGSSERSKLKEYIKGPIFERREWAPERNRGGRNGRPSFNGT